MYCPRCKENFSDFQSLCPNCFGELVAITGPDGIRPLADGFVNLLLEDMEGLTRSLETQPMLQMPDLDRMAVELGAQAGGLFEKPVEAAREGAERATGRTRQAAATVGAAAAEARRAAEAGHLSLENLQAARHDIMEALEAAARDLQGMAHSTREAVMAELRREGANSHQRAAELLRARQARIGQDLGRRLDQIRQRYGRIAQDLDPGTRATIRSRLESLQQQSSEVLTGLEKQIGGLPGPVQEIVRRAAAGDTEGVKETLIDLAQPAVQSVENVQAGCSGLVGVAASFVMPGLGHMVVGRFATGIGILVLYGFLVSAMPEQHFLRWLASGLAAWHVWMETRS